MSDALVREQALDPSRSILLQAPAGSGKTTVLAQRFLGLLGQVQEPEQLLAITFTRKAAAEMRERVLAALDGRLDGVGATGATWARLRAAALVQAQRQGWPLQDLGSRLRIQTIDSLNHEIARSMPVLGRFQGSLQVVDDASALYRVAALRALRFIDEEPQLQADADVLLERLDNNQQRAVDLVAQLLDARASWLPLILRNGAEGLSPAITRSLLRIVTASLQDASVWLPRMLQDEARELLHASARHREEQGHAGGRWRCWLDPATRLAPEAGRLEAWQAMVDMALTGAGEVRKSIDRRSGFPADDKPLKQRWAEWVSAVGRLDEARELLGRLRLLPPPMSSAADQAATAALARILASAAATLQLVFHEQGHVDHTEVAITALRALVSEGDPTDLGIRHTLRIHHLLVDEFQDVSPLQVELIGALTAGWSRGDGRSLFLVGDPMQSIYLFRHSEVGLFLRTRAHGIGALALESMQLRSNFRSRPGLVQWANRVFAGCFPRHEDLRSSAVGFLASEPARDDDPRQSAPVQVLSLPADDAAAEAVWIAGRIREAQAADPAQRIAILVRERRFAPPILTALQAAGISVRGVALASLAQHQTVLDLAALGAALLHGADQTAWLAVLRLPACGLLLADLATLVAVAQARPLVGLLARPDSCAGLSDDARQRLGRVGPLLADAWQQRQRMPLPDAIETLWRALGGEALATPAQRHVAMQYLAALRRLVHEYPAVDADALRQLAARLRDTPPVVAGEGPVPVEILTIHHAKGLEWDTVFVPGIGRPPRTERTVLMRWLELPADDQQQDLLLAVHSIGGDADQDALGAYIKSLQGERQRNEQLRLAYVAFTRARERLYLSGWAKPDPKSGQRSPAAGSLLARLWSSLGTGFPPAAAGDAAAATDSDTTASPVAGIDAPGYLRSRAGFDPHVHRRTLGLPAGLASVDTQTALRPEFTWVGPRARAEGTLVHALLETIARSGDWGWPAAPQAAIQARRQLLRLGLPEREAAELASQVLLRVQALADEPRARWLLDTGHREAHCELRLSGVVEGRLCSIIIDRSFVDGSGQRWVVDYKTSTHAGGDLAGFLASELERYRPQLALYRQLAARLGPEPVRAALYFPWLRQWVEMDHSPASENG